VACAFWGPPCLTGNPPPGPIVTPTAGADDDITCNNASNRSAAGNVIDLRTTGNGSSIGLFNSGTLNSTGADGIFARTTGTASDITIENHGPITAVMGIDVSTVSGAVTFLNIAGLATSGFGINASTAAGGLSFDNRGHFTGG
jgi:hypothetical protein